MVPDEVAVIDRELAELGALLEGGDPRVDHRQRFLELAERIATWQDVSLGTVVRRYL